MDMAFHLESCIHSFTIKHFEIGSINVNKEIFENKINRVQIESTCLKRVLNSVPICFNHLSSSTSLLETDDFQASLVISCGITFTIRRVQLVYTLSSMEEDFMDITGPPEFPEQIPMLEEGSISTPMVPPHLVRRHARPKLSELDKISHGFFVDFLKQHTCYELLPISSKIVVFDTSLLVKKAFYALQQNGRLGSRRL